MIRRHVFRFTGAADAVRARLLAAAGTAGAVTVETSGAEVKIARRHALPLLNGFSPVFVGSLREDATGTELSGRFRFHLGAIVAIAGFLGLSVWYLIQLLSGEPPAGAPPDWRATRIRFELQFLGFSLAALWVAWLAGRPVREQIIAFIDSQRQPQRPSRRRG